MTLEIYEIIQNAEQCGKEHLGGWNAGRLWISMNRLHF